MEILVSLLLLSVLGLVVWTGLARGQGLILRTFDAAAGSMRLLQLDTALRAAAGRVRVPYWEGDAGASSDAHSISVPWLDGYPDRRLSLETDGAKLLLSSTDREGREVRRAVFGPFASVALGLARSPEGEVCGILVSLGAAPGAPGAQTTQTAQGAQGTTLAARFGGQPLQPGSGP